MPVTFIGSTSGSPYLYDIIQELGLTTSLDFVLDAGDVDSFDGNSATQTWTDLTGNGNNFYRGTTSAAQATDPTFNGTADLATEATYFSFDGGDYFAETAAHTFADNWHKNNGAFSLVAIHYVITPTTISDCLFSNGFVTVPQNCILLSINLSNNAVLVHAIDNSTAETINLGALTVSSWNFTGVSFNEATPATNAQVNGTTSAPTTSASTSTTANPQLLLLGSQGSGASPIESGSRLACIAGWSTNIGATALNNIYTRLKSRRFTSLP